MEARVEAPTTRSIEQNGINAVPDEERHGRPFQLVWPWAAANLSLFGVAFGVYILGLGLGVIPAIVTGVLGYVLSFGLVGLVAVAGARSGVPTMTLGRAPFGYQGNKVPTLFSYISNVGWETVLVTLSTLGGGVILARLAPGAFAGAGGAPNAAAIGVCFGAVALTVIVVGVYGHAMIMAVQRYLTLVFVVLTLVYVALMLPRLGVGDGAVMTGDAGAWVGGIVLAMTLLGLGWVNCGADYSRYLPRDSSGTKITVWTIVGGVVAPILLLVFGVLLAGGDPSVADAAGDDPVAALAAALPTWFLVPYLIVAIGGFLSGAIMDIYSSGLSMLALGVPIKRHLAVLIDGLLMVLGGYYLLFISESFLWTFQAFLAIIGVVMAAWVAIFLTDMWRWRSGGRSYDLSLLAPGGPAVNWPGVISLVAASIVGLGLISSQDPNISQMIGYFMTEEMKSGTFGSANVGVIVALLLGGLLYGLLTLFWRPPAALGTGDGSVVSRHA